MGRSGIRKHRPKNPKRAQQGAYKDIVRENPRFDAFYKAQEGLCPPEEFDQMLASMKTDLPASFRITGFRSQAMVLRDIIQGEYMDKIANLADQAEQRQREEGGEANADEAVIVRPTCLPWYPDRMAWQLNITRKEIRREEAFHKLHNFLISETDSGNISRQETVSMIPPLVLDVKPHHKVLDMCAAPGSKTAQLIEAVHAVEDVVPEGLVVANDSDNARCYMLVHQAKRLQSPCLMITNHDASIMPNFEMTTDEGNSKVFMKYDRVLCDVPCSGDGTLRKNADIWPRWTPNTSVNLHGVQFRILKRGLELLEVGGRLVYSTCSLNPLEDEAVLYRMLVEAGDSIALADASGLVSGLKYSKGINKWKVGVKSSGSDSSASSGGLDMYSEFSEVPENLHSQIRAHMFAPPGGVDAKFKLDRCMRVLPHQQNTGGFFVAVIEKSKLCPWESTTKQPAANSQAAAADEKKATKPPPPKKRKFQGFKEDPFLYFPDNEPAFEEIKTYYDLKGLESNMFLTRCKDRSVKNNLYFTSQLVRNLVMNNEDRVKIINTGVKAFSKCENKGATCPFRLAQEGALMTIPFMNQRIIRPTRKDLQVLLLSSDIEDPPKITEMEEATQQQLSQIETGSIAYVFEEPQKDDKAPLKVELVGWKGKASVRAYVPKNDRIHYLRLVGGDTSKFETNKFEEKREAAAAAAAAAATSQPEEGEEKDVKPENGEDEAMDVVENNGDVAKEKADKNGQEEAGNNGQAVKDEAVTAAADGDAKKE